MFSRRHVPVLTALLLLSGMFLLGQNTWEPATTGLLPDTGQEACYDNEQAILCPSSGEPFHGQDAQYLDRLMSYTDNGDGTVRDDVTGLVWQQTHDDVYRRWEDALAYCEDLDLADQTDWRLPEVHELATIIDYGTHSPSIDTAYFPYTFPTNYWTATRYADLSYFSWRIAFNAGAVGTASQGDQYYARCVRGDPLPANLFTDNGNGTVTDAATGLTWQQSTPEQSLSWEEALAYCEDLDLAGASDWKLPNVKQLRSLIDPTRFDPAVDTRLFQEASYYGTTWTSTTREWVPTEGRYVEMYAGTSGSTAKVYSNGPANHRVRCVR